MSDDDIIRLVDDEPPPRVADNRTWKVANIDDDPSVHEGTRFALSD